MSVGLDRMREKVDKWCKPVFLGALRKLKYDSVTIESFENYSGGTVSIPIKATKEKCWMLDNNTKMEQN